MDSSDIIRALAALAQPTRLACFRRLVAATPDGMPAGDLARALDVPHNTMSAHLAILARAGLVTGRRHGRTIRYAARLDCLREMTLYLVHDCCGGRPDVCAPLIADLTTCRPQPPAAPDAAARAEPACCTNLEEQP